MTNPRGMPGPPPLGLNIDWCMGDQLKEIVTYGLSGKKLHEGLTEDELVDVGEGEFKILISSPKSLSENKNTGSATTITPKNCVCGH